VSILTYSQRQACWDWCREFIDREAIYRADDTHPAIPGKAKGSTYIWQFYSRRATLHPEFARRLGLLFWDHFLPVYAQQPFQVCACQPSGPPIGMAILTAATRLKIPVNLFIARREPKFGTDSWFDGHARRDLPVLMVDDIAASAPFLLLASVRVQQKLRLPLHRNYFTLVNKVGAGFNKSAQHTENYLDGELVAPFIINNFARSAADFEERYGRKPGWSGLVR
jgi:hypothetical protein